jgi:hypothetical protein
LSRYVRKGVGLSLCYDELAQPKTVAAAARVGTAGFLCCAYDVVTDWRSFEPEARRVFGEILEELVSSQMAKSLAVNLYDIEKSGLLGEDGLERGPIALRFVLAVTSNGATGLPAYEIDQLGRLLQIVDDVLDYEDDVVRGEVNCLTSANRAMYLRDLIGELHPAEVRRLFGRRCVVLAIVIDRARRKAMRFYHSAESRPRVA